MRRGTVVIGLGLGVLLSGCWGTGYGYGYGYHHRYYGGGYGYAPGVVYTQPQPVMQPVVVQGQVGAPPPPQAQVVVAGEGISGSDGSRGWRIVSRTPDQDFQRITQGAASARCVVEASTQGELRAACNNVHLIVRFDQQNVYKLCAPNTDPGVCAQTWSAIAP